MSFLRLLASGACTWRYPLVLVISWTIVIIAIVYMTVSFTDPAQGITDILLDQTIWTEERINRLLSSEFLAG